MNPRIQELAYEAEDYADSKVDEGGEFHIHYTQKFAELIIQECVPFVGNENSLAVKSMLKHFEVMQ